MKPHSSRKTPRPGDCLGIVVVLSLVLFGCASMGSDRVEQTGFDAPEQAVAELVAALEADDTDRLMAIFGPDGEKIVFSGDNVQDNANRKNFVRLYNQQHGLEKKSAQEAILTVGPDEWPFPVPIVKRSDRWYFDSRAGAEELLDRQIGRNELGVIEVMLAYTDAQREYAMEDRDGDGIYEYAQRMVSLEGGRDGLYWKAAENEDLSPFGPLVAAAAQEGYPVPGAVDSPPTPYRGYFYKILKKQGKHASGGAYDYVVDGKMIFGFALLAYPAEYGSSGIMTFMVNQEETVYEKDLGEDTAARAKAMTAYDPDPTWDKVAGQ
jgi:hypothetical protein